MNIVFIHASFYLSWNNLFCFNGFNGCLRFVQTYVSIVCEVPRRSARGYLSQLQPAQIPKLALQLKTIELTYLPTRTIARELFKKSSGNLLSWPNVTSAMRCLLLLNHNSYTLSLVHKAGFKDWALKPNYPLRMKEDAIFALRRAIPLASAMPEELSNLYRTRYDSFRDSGNVCQGNVGCGWRHLEHCCILN